MTAESKSVTDSVCHFFFASFPIDDVKVRIYCRVVVEMIYCWRYNAVT